MTNTISTVLVLASLMMGEGAVLTDCGMKAVGHVALNRYEVGMDDYLGEGFYGWEQPDARAVRLACDVLTEPDFTQGALYALSKDDVSNLNARPGDLIYKKGTWEVHLFYTWPENSMAHRRRR